jgi:urea carboxylase
MAFVAKNDAFTQKQFQDMFLNASLMMVAVGFFCALPLALLIDPRQRMNCPKMNPSRVFTPEGRMSWGEAAWRCIMWRVRGGICRRG